MSWPCPQYWSDTWCWPLPLVLTMSPVLVSHLVLATPPGVHHVPSIGLTPGVGHSPWCSPPVLVLITSAVLVSHLVLATPPGVHHLSWYWPRLLYWSHTWCWPLPLVFTTCPGIDHIIPSFDLLLLARKFHPLRQSEQTAQHGFAYI